MAGVKQYNQFPGRADAVPNFMEQIIQFIITKVILSFVSRVVPIISDKRVVWNNGLVEVIRIITYPFIFVQISYELAVTGEKNNA